MVADGGSYGCFLAFTPFVIAFWTFSNDIEVDLPWSGLL